MISPPQRSARRSASSVLPERGGTNDDDELVVRSASADRRGSRPRRGHSTHCRPRSTARVAPKSHSKTSRDGPSMRSLSLGLLAVGSSSSGCRGRALALRGAEWSRASHGRRWCARSGACCGDPERGGETQEPRPLRGGRRRELVGGAGRAREARRSRPRVRRRRGRQGDPDGRHGYARGPGRRRRSGAAPSAVIVTRGGRASSWLLGADDARLHVLRTRLGARCARGGPHHRSRRRARERDARAERRRAPRLPSRWGHAPLARPARRR